jgi:uncharacterized protein YkwD
MTIARRAATGWGCCLLLAAMMACASSSSQHASNLTRSARFTALGAPSATYTTKAASGEAVRGPYAQPVRKAIAQALAARAQPDCAPDARLGDLAEWIARSLDQASAPPPNPVIDLWARQLGLVEPTPHLIVLGEASGADLESKIRAEIATMLGRQRYTHYGAATVNHAGGAFAVLVLSWRWLELRPLTRRLAIGAPLVLTGTLARGLHGAQLVVSYPDGSSHRGPPQSGSKIAVTVPIRGSGEHRVELLASSELGITVVANFPVYVGVEPTREITVAIDSDSVAALSEDEAKRRFLGLLNQQRKRAGLAALTPLPVLDDVARAHSTDMQLHHFVGHTSATTGSAEDRVKRAGVRSTLILENIGRGYSPEEVHRGLMDSPGHRANLLHPQATHVGLGVVPAPEDTRTSYLLTQVFVRLARKVEIDVAKTELSAAIDRERKRRGARKLERDAALDELCAETARDFFRRNDGASNRELLDRLNQKARSGSGRAARMAGLITIVVAAQDAAELDALLDQHARSLGLGLAQGTRADTVENAIAVVALVGY